MAHDTDIVDLPVRRLDPVPPRLRVAAFALLVVGGIALIASFLVDIERAWQAYLFNWLFFTSVANGAVLLAALVSITKGVWSRPIRRIALSFVAFTPLSLLLMLPIFLGADHIFPWRHIDLGDGAKSIWLNIPFLAARDILFYGGLVLVELMFAYWALRPDVELVRADAPQRLHRFYDRFRRGWRGQEAEEVRSFRKLSVLAPVLALTYAFGMSFIAWDLIMSLEPYWWSTLFGPYFFMAALLGGTSATILLTVYYRNHFGWDHIILPSNLHDIGKLNFAFSIFWAYLFWAQFIVLWYGLIPHEQAYVIHRLSGGYAPISILVFLFLFIFPFFGLLGVLPKRAPRILATFSGIVLVGLFLERYLLTYPSWYFEEGNIVFGWQEIGMALFFGGVMLTALTAFAHRFPMLQHWQPVSELELLGVPVEATHSEQAAR